MRTVINIYFTIKNKIFIAFRTPSIVFPRKRITIFSFPFDVISLPAMGAFKLFRTIGFKSKKHVLTVGVYLRVVK
jgi:hypothetical protein